MDVGRQYYQKQCGMLLAANNLGRPTTSRSRTYGKVPKPLRQSCGALATQTVRGGLTFDWENLPFGLENVGETMYLATYEEGSGWQGGTRPYGPIDMMPSAQALNYGQAIFEGMKAQRTKSGNVVLFRPTANAARMRQGAKRLCMAEPPESLFIEAVTSTVRANAQLIPPPGKGSMYIRPLLLGSGPILGLGPAPTYTFLVYSAAVGQYFTGALDLLVETKFHRSAPGGMGGTKAAGNYSPVLPITKEAKKEGYHDVLYLDARTDTYIEEVSSCNIFVVKDGTIRTSPLEGSILPGITRASLIELARWKGYNVLEEHVSIDEALASDEVFTCGTAVGVSPVGSLTYKGTRTEYASNGNGFPVVEDLGAAFMDIVQQQASDPFEWVYEVPDVDPLM